MEIGENRFRPGPAKADYQAGFVLRFNLTRRLHLQSELNFAFVNYSIRAEGSRTRSVSLRSERFEIPLQLGLQFGPLRLFGGAQFRVADSERDSAPKLLKVNFNDDVGIMGGVGFNIRKFFSTSACLVTPVRTSGTPSSPTACRSGSGSRATSFTEVRSGSSSEQKTRVRRRTLFLHNK